MPKRDYVESTGNVFADLGLPRPDEVLAKAELAQKIVAIIHERRLTQTEAAAILGIDTGTSKSQLSRARKILRERLHPRETHENGDPK